MQILISHLLLSFIRLTLFSHFIISTYREHKHHNNGDIPPAMLIRGLVLGLKANTECESALNSYISVVYTIVIITGWSS